MTYKFNRLDDAQEYLHSRLLKHNENNKIEKEKLKLTPYRPLLELATISENKGLTLLQKQIKSSSL